jgi:hypothetical protein
MRVRLDEHVFCCIESPLPAAGEGWGEGRESLSSFCYVSQTGQAGPWAAECIH